MGGGRGFCSIGNTAQGWYEASWRGKAGNVEWNPDFYDVAEWAGLHYSKNLRGANSAEKHFWTQRYKRATDLDAE